jgi:hypothetical protein
LTHAPPHRSGYEDAEQVPAPHPEVGLHVGEPFAGAEHVLVVIHVPPVPHDWNALSPDAHCVCRGAHTPTHVPALHVWFVQGAPLVIVPPTQDQGVLPVHPD